MKTMGCLLATLVLGLVGGCATTPRVDWNTRIGNYTYDQAVSELGKPARQDTKPEGTRVAEWLTQRGSPGTIGVGMDAGSAPPGVIQGPIAEGTPRTLDRYLRLTFGPDGKLTQWERVSRSPSAGETP